MKIPSATRLSSLNQRLSLTVKLPGIVCALSLPLIAQTPETPETTEPPLPGAGAGSILSERPAASRMVKEIDVRFRTAVTVDRARVLSRMRLKVGEPWSKEKEEDDLRSFYNSGDLMNATIDTIDVAGGLKVVVTAEARPAMGDLVFQGNTVFNSDRLKDLVEFTAGGVVDDTKLSEAKVKILDLYKKKGYPDAVVTYEVEPASQPGFSRIVIRIDEGGRGVIDGVLFEGNTVFSSRRLRGVVESDNRNWLKVWDLKRKLDREKLERDMAAVQNLYGDNGYFDARVTGVEPVPSGKDDKVNLVFHIVEGPQYTTGEVSMAGNKVFESATLIPVFQLEAGRTFSLAGMKADIETIEEYYGSHGYAEVRVTPRIDKRAGNQLFITYSIDEGGQFKVGKIHIIGNEGTQDAVIRRELAIDPGDDYNTIKIRKSLQRIRGLDYFEENGVDFMPVASELGADFKDINITVDEKKTGSLVFGGGFSSIDSIFGRIELTQRNFDITNWPSFTGGGQRFRMTLLAGSRRKDFLLSLTEPYFMGERLSLGGELFWTEKINYLSDYYDQRDVGGTLNLRRPLGDNTDIRFSYTLQQVELYNMDEDEGVTDPLLLDEEGDYLQSRIGASIVYDNRNSIQQPSQGHKFTFESMMSGGFIGGDVETYSLSLAGQKYWKLPGRTIFSLEGKAAVVDAINGGDVPIFERLFLGGANNMRGFEFRDVGPKYTNPAYETEGEAKGGNTSAWLTAEYTFPIFRKVRGAVFADAGFVNEDAWDFSTSDFNADVGLGVRFVFPGVGPLKFDYGIPVTSDDYNDEGGQFNWSMDIKY